MAALVNNVIKLSGQNATLVAAGAAGDIITPGDHVFLEVLNGSGASVDVTIPLQGNDDFGRPNAPLVVAVAAGARSKIGPLTHRIADPATGKVPVSYSATGSVSVGAFSS